MQVTFLDLDESAVLLPVSKFPDILKKEEFECHFACPLRDLSSNKVQKNGPGVNSIYLLDGKTKGLIFRKGNIVLASSSRLMHMKGGWDRYENCITCLRYSPTYKVFTDERSYCIAFDGSLCVEGESKAKQEWLKKLCFYTNDIMKKAAKLPDSSFKTYKVFGKQFEAIWKSVIPKGFLEENNISDKPTIYSI